MRVKTMVESIMSYPDEGTLTFTVDSALLRELGVHLVGKPYIALAELVKNSYDADATKVTIELDVYNDQIIVKDNGYGMTYQEFVDYWMCIGTTHKQDKRESRNLHRKMRGEKGVGRLAIQLLANKLELQTVSDTDPTRMLKASVRWSEAVSSPELTKAPVHYEIVKATDEKLEEGTVIILTELEQKWSSKFVRDLAKEIWWLQPPFRNPLKDVVDKKHAFQINFKSTEKEFEKIFDQQLTAIFDIWYAKIVGENDHGKITFSLEYHGEEPLKETYSIPDCELENGKFEIRLYHLFRRQPKGISVNDARVYFNEFGGVHVYDGGFHLPYYGVPENDWLKIEWAHSHRLSRSPLLPEKYQIPRGLQFLPTLSRIFGVVNISTTQEPKLRILITRDRLQDNKAYDNLVQMVRYTLDYYSYVEKLRSLKEKMKQQQIVMPSVQEIDEVIEKYEEYMPPGAANKFRSDIHEVTSKITEEAKDIEKQASTMGSLASVGASTLAFQHETRKQFNRIENIIEEIGSLEEELADKALRKKVQSLKEQLLSWLTQAKETFRLFGHFLDTESMTDSMRYNALKVVREILNQLEYYKGGIQINLDKLDSDLLLPAATLAEWTALFQNVVINAFNALLDAEKKLIDISSRKKGLTHEILIQDTGVGVDLKESEELFKPFVRKIKISPERQQLGYGGSGIGLTIVRMIANRIGCRVYFMAPEEGFNTAFSIIWRERK